MLDNFLFVGLPYITMLLLIGGSIYRAFTGAKTAFRGRLSWGARGDFLWTTRSTGFFGRASIGPAALCLHWGMLLLVIGHVLGFIGGSYNATQLVDLFRWAGLIGGILLLYGLCWAFARRLSSPQLRAMSTSEDYIVLLLLIAIAALGLYHSGIRLAWGISFAVGPWFAGLFRLQPDASLLAAAPFSIKLHMVIGLLFLAYLPFTKLVHAFSFPFGYFSRPYISMRRYVGLKR